MTRTVVLDTSVIVSALSTSDVLYEVCATFVRAARDAGDAMVVPMSAYGEAMVGALGRGGHDPRALLRLCTEVARLAPLDRACADQAARLRVRNLPGLRLPDALVLGTGLALDAAVIATTDRRWAGYSDRVEVLA